MAANGEARAPGTVVAIRGGVVDVRFDNAIPALRNLLVAGDDGAIQSAYAASTPER